MTSNKQTKRYWDVDFCIKYLTECMKVGTFQANENTIKAINGIIEWVNNQRKITKNENLLFAKLYISNLTKTANRYQTTGFNKEVIKEVSRILTTPLNVLENEFCETLNDDKDKKLFKKNGICLKHLTRTDEKLKEDSLNITKMDSSDNDIKSLKEPGFDKKTEIQKLYRMFTEALNRFQ